MDGFGWNDGGDASAILQAGVSLQPYPAVGPASSPIVIPRPVIPQPVIQHPTPSPVHQDFSMSPLTLILLLGLAVLILRR